ncbi:MAG: 30S ribosomal protein S2 [Patescibacteria group bacterium]|nr:30S ribosomal protein S2 [Patescibacteria group bacterium]
MRNITLEELLQAGCHFGHQITRSNPKARDYIFEARDKIHIIDLAKTKETLEEAGAFIRDLGATGGTLLIVGTKRQAREIVEKEIERVVEKDGLFCVTNRWIGGTLTNFSEVAKNFKKLRELAERLANDEEKAKYTKKEVGLWLKEKQKLESLYGGIADMKRNPDALFVIDSHLEDLAVSEARKMEVKTVAIVDTNADPELIDYPIPANDDASGSIKLIVSYIIDAWIEGRTALKKQEKKVSEVKAAEEAKDKDKKVKDAKETEKKTIKKQIVTKKSVKKKGEKDGKGKSRSSKKTS